MDTAVQTALTTALGDFAGEAVTQLGNILPVAAPVIISVAGVFFAIKLLRGMLHM